MSITHRDCPQKIVPKFPSWSGKSGLQGRHTRSCTALGHQGAPGKRRPEQRDGCCMVTAAPGLESVNFTQSVCGLLGARQGPGPGPWHTHCSLERGQLVLSSHSLPAPRRGFQSRSGQGVGRESEDGLRMGRVAPGQLPPRAPPISESPTPLQSLSPINPLLSETPFLPFCGSGPEA